MVYIIGQALGIVATVVTILMPMFQKKWQILAATMAGNILMTLNFVMIGQIGSAIFLYFVAIVQSVVSMIHTVRNTNVSKTEQILFFALYVGFGFFGMFTAPGFVMEINAQNLLELMPIVGSTMLNFSIFAKGEQTTRKFLLANVLIWAVYTAIIGSTIFFAELFAVISTTIALIKYRKQEV